MGVWLWPKPIRLDEGLAQQLSSHAQLEILDRRLTNAVQTFCLDGNEAIVFGSNKLANLGIAPSC
jgi:hypothetical protein